MVLHILPLYSWPRIHFYLGLGEKLGDPTGLFGEFWSSNQNNEEKSSLCQLEIDFFPQFI